MTIFLPSYPRAVTHTQQMKSLVEISRRVAAVSAGLLGKGSGGFTLDLSVGLSEKSRQRLRLDAVDPLCRLIFADRKTVAMNRNPAELGLWRNLIDVEDMKYMKRILLFPALFRSQEAYLLLAFAADQDIALNGIVSKLLLRFVSRPA